MWIDVPINKVFNSRNENGNYHEGNMQRTQQHKNIDMNDVVVKK